MNDVSGAGKEVSKLVVFALAVIGVIGAGLPIVALILAAVCFVLLRRTLGR